MLLRLGHYISPPFPEKEMVAYHFFILIVNPRLLLGECHQLRPTHLHISVANKLTTLPVCTSQQHIYF